MSAQPATNRPHGKGPRPGLGVGLGLGPRPGLGLGLGVVLDLARGAVLTWSAAGRPNSRY
jgi:hypothetical protein